jgi:hypothetical protein
MHDINLNSLKLKCFVYNQLIRETSDVYVTSQKRNTNKAKYVNRRYPSKLKTPL